MLKKIILLFLLISSSSFIAQIEGTWKLSPTDNAMGCGPNQGDISWWSNNIGDVSARSCFFDDSITFFNNGTLMHYMGDETWLETWQGVSDDGCGIPIYPHDGGEASWSINNGQLTIAGYGAHIGLPKAFNGGELSSVSEAVDEIIYEITMSTSGDAFTADILSAGDGQGWWRFEYVKTLSTEQSSYSVTLQVDASNITVGDNGMYAGGGVLGGAQAVQLTDDDGDNIWEGIGTFPAEGGYYIFLNSPSYDADWGTKENLEGLPCSDPSNWNDRTMPPLSADTTVCFEFGNCNTCFSLPQPEFTSIPDQNFEQALIDLGHDDFIDGQVLTTVVNNIDSLNISEKNILDLTGIEDFTDLSYLNCQLNQLTNLNLSQNINLTSLYCNENQLTNLTLNSIVTFLNCSNNQLDNLHISSCSYLSELDCQNNQISNLDVSQNSILNILNCSYNQIPSLDFSNNIELFNLNCSNNPMSCLNLKNENNLNFTNLNVTNTLLECIEVDDTTWAYENWTFESGNIDNNVIFSVNCNYPSYCFEYACNTIVFDTTEMYVSSIEFQDISPDYNLIAIATFIDANSLGCDSIVYRYNKYIYNPNYFTEYDTTYFSIGVEDTLYIDAAMLNISDANNIISIYPNPANEYIIIDYGNYTILNNYSIKILNNLSQPLLESPIETPQLQIPLSLFTITGFYIVQIFDSNNNLVTTKYLVIE